MDTLTFWIVAGIILLILEMLTGGFFLLFIAIGSFAAALGHALGENLTAQGLTCAIVSVLGVALFRRPIQRRLLKRIELSADVGKEIQSDQPIPPHQQARIQYQGTSWLATNLDSEEIRQGDRVIIVGIDGNTLLVRKYH